MLFFFFNSRLASLFIFSIMYRCSSKSAMERMSGRVVRAGLFMRSLFPNRPFCLMGAEAGHLITGGLKGRSQWRFKLKSTMVCSDANTHHCSLLSIVSNFQSNLKDEPETRASFDRSRYVSEGLHSLVVPFPVTNLRQVLAVFINVLLVLDELVLHHLLQIGPLGAQLR